MKKRLSTLFGIVCAAVMLTGVQAQDDTSPNKVKTHIGQTEEQFQQLMPITGKVETFFGDFQHKRRKL